MRLGFIGLGNMGAPMAGNLVRAGHRVVGYDVSQVMVEGVEMASSASEAVRGADVVVTMLPSGAIVGRVYEEIVPKADPDTLLVDCSTIDVESARLAHELAAAHDLPSLDAPVSGGVAGARAASLTFMAGGSQEAFQRAEPLLRAMGKRVIHCGGPGAGQAAKICNNMILGISMLGVCEAIGLADRLELDRQKLYEVVSTSSGSCWAMNSYCPMPGVGPESPADHGYRPGFAAELMLKDLQLSQDAARTVDAATPMGRRALELYEEFVAEGGEGQDFSAILMWLELGRDATRDD